MGEVEEQRYVCKICSKGCVSGKSLGGHMRIHLAQISASKKAAKAEAEIKINDDQSNSALLSEEKINKGEINTDFGDGDQNNSYELRENPKKSWRISDPKHGVTKNLKSCKECDKEFPSLKALNGHMRCHSIKNKKQVHQCKKCGRGFGSIKAMFGHMKCHSNKSRNLANDTTDHSVSELENFCPVRRKRSRIRYNSSPNPSLSNLNVSSSDVDEVGEAATCLIMLSRGVRDCLNFETELSDDYDRSYFRRKEFSRCDGEFMSEVEKKSLSTVKLESCYSGYAKAFSGKNVNELDDLDSKFAVEDQINVEIKVSDDDFVCTNGWINVHKVLKYDQLYEFDEGSSELFEYKGKKVISSVCESHSEKSSSENEANLDILEHYEKRHDYNKTFHSESISDGALNSQSSKRREYGCLKCLKVFSSGQALGGHKRAHYNAFAESKNREAMATNQEEGRVQDMFDLNLAVGVDEGEVGISSWWIDRSNEHEALVFD